MSILIALAAAFAAIEGALAPPVCRAVSFEQVPHIVCSVPSDAAISLHLNDDSGVPLGQFDVLAKTLPKPPIMAMNGGMYHADRSPVGLYVEGGSAISSLVTRAGPGNFGLLPNGVFWSDGTRVFVTETRAYKALSPTPKFATQSGPMLVIDGALHPRFKADSESRKRRNGVGIAGDQIVFAISDAPVTFHHFARLFRDYLDADNALFLDGSISRIYAPELERTEWGLDLGPMIAVTLPEASDSLAVD